MVVASATETEFPPGVLATGIPMRVAVATSMRSVPSPTFWMSRAFVADSITLPGR